MVIDDILFTCIKYNINERMIKMKELIALTNELSIVQYKGQLDKKFSIIEGDYRTGRFKSSGTTPDHRYIVEVWASASKKFIKCRNDDRIRSDKIIKCNALNYSVTLNIEDILYKNILLNEFKNHPKFVVSGSYVYFKLKNRYVKRHIIQLLNEDITSIIAYKDDFDTEIQLESSSIEAIIVSEIDACERKAYGFGHTNKSIFSQTEIYSDVEVEELLSYYKYDYLPLRRGIYAVLYRVSSDLRDILISKYNILYDELPPYFKYTHIDINQEGLDKLYVHDEYLNREDAMKLDLAYTESIIREDFRGNPMLDTYDAIKRNINYIACINNGVIIDSSTLKEISDFITLEEYRKAILRLEGSSIQRIIVEDYIFDKYRTASVIDSMGIYELYTMLSKLSLFAWNESDTPFVRYNLNSVARHIIDKHSKENRLYIWRKLHDHYKGDLNVLKIFEWGILNATQISLESYNTEFIVTDYEVAMRDIVKNGDTIPLSCFRSDGGIYYDADNGIIHFKHGDINETTKISGSIYEVSGGGGTPDYNRRYY